MNFVSPGPSLNSTLEAFLSPSISKPTNLKEISSSKIKSLLSLTYKYETPSEC